MTDKLPLHTAFLSLGTNLGNRESHLKKATEQIKLRIGQVTAVSSIYETAPWGFESSHAFLNMCIRVETRLTAHQVLYILQAIERKMGRIEKTQGSYQDRIIDLDIILYDRLEIDTPELVLPHPLYKERDFVMKPLMEILHT